MALTKSPFVVCYICGREYGSASISIHQPKCLDKWHQVNNKLPMTERLNAPIKPNVSISSDMKNLSDYNKAALQASLYPCEKCNRTFSKERLEKHQKVCVAKPVKGSSKERPLTAHLDSPKILFNEDIAKRLNTSISHEYETRNKTTMKRSKPISILCYICGRPYGTQSILLHEPKCFEKWKLENNKLAPNQKRPEPVKPEEMKNFFLNGYTNYQELDEYNKLAFESGLKQRIECEICKRRFNPDRLEVHARSCHSKH